MGLLRSFKEFAMRGNVVDLAVGVIIGGAFGRIVDSLVKDVLLPLINAMFGGGVDFSNKYVVLSGTVPPGASLEAAQKAGVVFAWGNFLTVAINFVLLALVVFVLVRMVNRLRRPVEEAPKAPPEDVVLLREIRDELKRR